MTPFPPLVSSPPIDGASYDDSAFQQIPGYGFVEPPIYADGSGRLADELQYEATQQALSQNQIQQLDVGLLGYSMGGGVADKLSFYLKTSPYTLGALNVRYAATIDPVSTVNTGLLPRHHTHAPLTASPAAWWPGCTGFNYWEPLDPRQFGSLPGVTNQEFISLNHGQIGTNDSVFQYIEADLNNFYGSLSGGVA